MFFTKWFSSPKRPAPSYKPTVLELEDRTVPSTFFSRFFPPPGPATHLQVVTPEQVHSGREFDVYVAAEDSSNRLATGYGGTIHFNLGVADGSATVPVDYTFTSRDRGFHEFHFTLSALGSQTITATDTATASITGSAATNDSAAPLATHLLVKTWGHTVPGVPTSVTVVALDASNHKVPEYAGTVAITSSDGAAVLPSNYAFVAADHGVHTFQVTFSTAGSPTVTATDTTTASITGQASITVESVGPVTHFGVYAFPVTLAGFATPVQIVALDANNRQVAGYTGTVHFTSTDSGATLPSDYIFVAGDHGSHLFSVTFAASGKQTLTATDAAAATVAGKVNFYVIAQLPKKRMRW